ncbi:hypothetical protein [Salinispora arenicola]|uniref:hypothetical protein n=1 Tax=Salinispora arenicola TaxID=168697 RepID=UPI001693FAB3|nr:hypothetical protein [Salinispora arenicola]NIL64667.1 hypothetical protein [Salinispora arenicola]
MSQANDTAAALERTDWNLLDSLRNLSGRVDGIGTSDAGRRRLAEDAASNDTTRRLRPALERAHADAVRLLTEASRVAVQPEPWKPDPTDEPDKRSSARDDDQGPSDHADVATSGTVTASGRDLEAKLREVRRLAAQRPDTQITVNWTVVDEQ